MLDDLYYLRERARQSVARGDLDDAANALVTAAQQTHIAEHDYVSVLKPLEQVLAQRGDVRSALSVNWYLAFGEKDGFKRAYGMLKTALPVDRARTMAAAGDMAGAAVEMENAGLVAAAAIYREKALDWQGARAVKKIFPGMVYIYIVPPSIDELQRRLVARAKDPPEVIARRLAAAREDLKHVHNADYVIINHDFNAALADLCAITRACQLTATRQISRHADLIM